MLLYRFMSAFGLVPPGMGFCSFSSAAWAAASDVGEAADALLPALDAIAEAGRADVVAPVGLARLLSVELIEIS